MEETTVPEGQPSEQIVRTPVTDEALAARLATAEEKGKAIAARIAAGEHSETVTQVIRHGDWVGVSALEYSLNGLRGLWKDTKREINNRKAA